MAHPGPSQSGDAECQRYHVSRVPSVSLALCHTAPSPRLLLPPSPCHPWVGNTDLLKAAFRFQNKTEQRSQVPIAVLPLFRPKQ